FGCPSPLRSSVSTRRFGVWHRSRSSRLGSRAMTLASLNRGVVEDFDEAPHAERALAPKRPTSRERIAFGRWTEFIRGLRGLWAAENKSGVHHNARWGRWGVVCP